MVSIVVNSAGTTIPNIIVNDISERHAARTVVFDLPTAAKDTIQNMGTKNTVFQIKGWAFKTGSAAALSVARTNLTALKGTTGSINSDLMTQTHVFYQDVRIRDRGGRIYDFEFTIDAIEVI